MKLKTLLPLAFIAASGATFAAQQDVATVSSLTGQILLEKQNGMRTPLQAGMVLKEGEHIMVLEKSSVKLTYSESNCVADYAANTLLPISAANQCAAGQVLAIGQAAVEVSAEALKAAATAAEQAGVLGAATSGVSVSAAAAESIINAILLAAPEITAEGIVAALQAALGSAQAATAALTSLAAGAGAATTAGASTITFGSIASAAGISVGGAAAGSGVFAVFGGATITGLGIALGIVTLSVVDEDTVETSWSL